METKEGVIMSSVEKALILFEKLSTTPYEFSLGELAQAIDCTKAVPIKSWRQWSRKILSSSKRIRNTHLVALFYGFMPLTKNMP